MRCLLHGHLPQRFPGSGAFTGQEFDICVHCGKTWPVIDGVRQSEPMQVDARDYPIHEVRP